MNEQIETEVAKNSYTTSNNPLTVQFQGKGLESEGNQKRQENPQLEQPGG